MIDDNRLYAIVLRLAAMRPGALPPDHGEQGRAALLKLIREGDSPLATQLHDENNAKPYTISMVRGGQRTRDGLQHFGEGDSAEWRFSLMMQPMFEALLQKYLLNNSRPHVRIGVIDFAITDVYVSSASHTDSGYISIGHLVDRWNKASHEQLPRRTLLDFQSPTAFSLGHDRTHKRYRYRVFPDARTVFSTLRKSWVKLGGVDVGNDFDTWVDKTIEAEPLHYQLCKHRVEGRTVSAFTGQIVYQHYGTDERWLSYLNLLADLTFWTGIGYQTTRGMGQVRCLSTGGDQL